jgi:hypothetical protein
LTPPAEGDRTTARLYGTIGIVGVGGWVLANLLLHVLVPELSVVNNTLSEYALGDFGWLKRAAEFANGVGLVAIALGLRATLAPACPPRCPVDL